MAIFKAKGIFKRKGDIEKMAIFMSEGKYWGNGNIFAQRALF